MTKPTPYQSFGKLLSAGIKQTSLARRESLQQTHQYLADELGYVVNTLYVWRRGEHLPDNPVTVADLARIFAKTWGADQKWVNDFLDKGEYGPVQAVEALNQELFGSQAPVVSRSLTPQTGASRAIPTQSTPDRQVQPYTLSGHRLAVAFLNFLAVLFFRILEIAPDSLTGGLLDRVQGGTRQETPEKVALFPVTCGDKGIVLAEQRLLVSSAFGAYFVGLLERDHSYIDLGGQIEVQSQIEQAAMAPLQRLYWALQSPRGPRLIIIAADGGMGKSTLAARLVRCLFEENAIDMILGDSAKTQQVDPFAGTMIKLNPGYYDPASFYRQLFAQLGLPGQDEVIDSRTALRNIRDRLEGRRAVIFVDNLESVSSGTELLRSLQQLATRDTRVIVTTRTVSGLAQWTPILLLVRLNPITHVTEARQFLNWHIRTYAAEHPDLEKLESDGLQERYIQRLLDRTGGIPLLMQLVLSDVARYSWQYLDELPELFGTALLGFLYQERWNELAQLGAAGRQARQMLQFVWQEQYRGKKITFAQLNGWSREVAGMETPQPALFLLQERFLLVNHDHKQGHFAIFPSLAEFLSKRTLDE